MFGPPAASAGRVEILGAALRELGYIEGKNIVIETMWAEPVDELPGLAAELVRRNVDVIFAPSSTEVEPGPTSYTHNSHRIRIPCRSGRHRTCSEPAAPRREHHGLTMLLTDLSAKELEILKQAVPQAGAACCGIPRLLLMRPP
jgi:putative ABC transport system substrate-binding protein